MRAWAWAFVAAMGWGVMFAAYVTRERPEPNVPWANGVLVVGPDLPSVFALKGRKTKVQLRLVPASDQVEEIIRGVGIFKTDAATKLATELRSKLFLLPVDGANIDAEALQSGRLPEAGKDEIIAGASATHHDRLTVGDRDLRVVGVLKPGADLIQNSYLIPASDQASELYRKFEPSVRTGTFVELAIDQRGDRRLAAKLQEDLPPETYSLLMPPDSLPPRTSYLYLAGMAVFLIAGAGALIGLFRWLAPTARPASGTHSDGLSVDSSTVLSSQTRARWWAAPLIEMAERPRLVWGVHLAYFGLVILGSLLVSQFPDIQRVLLSNLSAAFNSPGPLAVAAKAYATGNIAYAAGVTFLINFFLGSLLVITFPSIIVPGSGIFMAGLRSAMWGVLFAPTIGWLAYGMLAHCGTMLLEGEGYVLATLFGLLIPIHLCQASLGGNALSRFGRVLWLNVLANFWVAVVLIVAACYEATEVIWMSR